MKSSKGRNATICAVAFMVVSGGVYVIDGIEETSTGVTVTAESIPDARVCGEPERYENGRIKRSATLIRKFKELYPLPEQYDESKWSVDHVIPLGSSLGGCDSIINLQWLPNTIKTCAGTECKDRWERKVYVK